MPILDLSRPPEPWSIVEIAPGQGGLRLGARRLSLADVVGWEASSVAELNYDGHMLAAGMFLGGAALFVLPVIMAILHPRFLMGGILFACIGLAIMADIGQGHSMAVHRILIRLADGRTETFTSADVAECQRLLAALEAQDIGRRQAGV